jgi:hypothetical protein
LIPVKGYDAINLMGICFVRKGVVITDDLINHEKIHTAQMKELLYIFFYVFYVIEWVLKSFKYGKNSYRNISFEREAYQNDEDFEYLKNRRYFAFLKYF